MQQLATLLLVFLSSSLFAQKTSAPVTGKPPAKPGTAAPASKPGTTPSTLKPSVPSSLPAVASPPAEPWRAGAKEGAKATAVTKDTAILRLFEKPADIKWVKYFKGRLDDATVVDITLGFDGRNCRGYLTYAKSRIRFSLSGTFNTDGFSLEERDMARGVTGSLRGTLNNRRLEAEWVNTGNTLGSRLEAEEVAQGQVPTLDCSDNKWSSRYITRFNGARCDMVLVRSHNGALDGFLWVESDGRTYRLKGDLKPDGDYEMEVLGSDDRLAALLSGNLKAGQNTDCNWVGSGERRSFKFTLKDHFLLGCYEYADYATSYDVLYPRTPCAHCNTQLDDQVNQWVERCQAAFAAKKIPLSPINRASKRASAWPEIACWTDNIFAGYVTFSDTWTDQAQGISFNYDLRLNKEISLEDLFNKGFNAQKYLSDWANREMPKLSSFASDPIYRLWLTKEGFPLFALRREGLEISTLFHPQYGRQTLLVPYSGLKTYLKKDSPVGEFIK
ncbi:MAG: hypothetical protein H7246_18860 [Phycisphaerae bacterium]|nr:hypothetical protein [Saprospiraceae bacterium]